MRPVHTMFKNKMAWILSGTRTMSVQSILMVCQGLYKIQTWQSQTRTPSTKLTSDEWPNVLDDIGDIGGVSTKPPPSFSFWLNFESAIFDTRWIYWQSHDTVHIFLRKENEALILIVGLMIVFVVIGFLIQIVFWMNTV